MPPTIIWKRLLALDFDNTIADDNTDLVARDLIVDRRHFAQRCELPELLEPDVDWTEHMQRVFNALHERNVPAGQLMRRISAVPAVDGMVESILELVRRHNFDAIIVSGSNTAFIEAWCRQRAGLRDAILEVFAPRAHVDAMGCLRVEPYHERRQCRTDYSTTMCKGDVLEAFIERRFAEAQVAYGQTFFVGDAENDLCAVERLSRRCDHVAARRDYPLAAMLAQKRPEYRAQCVCDEFVWSTGEELLKDVQKRLRLVAEYRLPQWEVLANRKETMDETKEDE